MAVTDFTLELLRVKGTVQLQLACISDRSRTSFGDDPLDESRMGAPHCLIYMNWRRRMQLKKFEVAVWLQHVAVPGCVARGGA